MNTTSPRTEDADEAPDGLIRSPLEKRRADPTPETTPHDPGDNLITNPLDKPGARDNLIPNPIEKRR